MTSQEMLDNLTSYFSGSYPQKLIEELGRVCGNIHEDDRLAVYEEVRDTNKPGYKIGVNAVVDACRKLGIAYRRKDAFAAKVIDWACECGTPYLYQQGVGNERFEDRVYDVCPRCGLDPQDMIRAQAEAERGDGKRPEWFFRVFGEHYKAHCLPEKEPHIDRRKDKAWSDEEAKVKAAKFKAIIDDEAARIVKIKTEAMSGCTVQA